MSDARRARRDGGFALIDVLVALVVLGLTLGALLTGIARALDGAARAEHSAYALAIQQSRLDVAILVERGALSAAPMAGSEAGYRWRVDRVASAAGGGAAVIELTARAWTPDGREVRPLASAEIAR